MAMPAIDIRRVLGVFQDAVRDTNEKMQAVHGPQWEARSEVTRNIVAVASAVFAGSVAFFDDFQSSSNCFETAALVTSWILLLLSICAGIYVLWQAIALNGFYPRLFNAQPDMRARLERLNPAAPDLLDQVMAIAAEAIDGVTKAIGVADIRASRASRASLVLFILGLCFMLLYAVVHITASGT